MQSQLELRQVSRGPGRIETVSKLKRALVPNSSQQLRDSLHAQYQCQHGHDDQYGSSKCLGIGGFETPCTEPDPDQQRRQKKCRANCGFLCHQSVWPLVGKADYVCCQEKCNEGGAARDMSGWRGKIEQHDGWSTDTKGTIGEAGRRTRRC